MNYLGIFCSVSFIMRIFSKETGLVSVYLFITIIISFVVNLILYVMRSFIRDVTYGYIHDKEHSTMLSVYLTSGNLMLIVSLILANPVLSNVMSPEESEKELYMDSAVKTIFLLSVIYIVFIIYRGQDAYQNNRQLENELYKAKMFRLNSQRELIISYSVNMRNAEMKDGMQFFKDELWNGTDGNYFKMLEKFSEVCVHPVDRGKMGGQEAPVLANDTLRNTPSFKHRLRVSPANVVKYCNLNARKTEDLERTNKEWIWSEVNVSLIRDRLSGEVISYITILDIDEKVESENALVHELKVDPATGFYEGESFGEVVRMYMSRQDVPGVLFLIDLVGFGSSKRERGRKADMLGITDDGIITVYAPYMIDLSLLIEKAMQVINHLKVAGEDAGNEVSVCIGIAIYPKDGTGYNELYRHAESALYQAHIAGKDAYRFYERQE